MSALLFIVSLAVLAWMLTGLLRRYALARSLMDVPNARSSHSVPTPRGGGVAIVIAFLLGLSLAFFTGFGIPAGLYYALLGAGAGIAVLGFFDDHGHIAARWRLLGHFAAAIWALYWLGGLPPLAVFGMALDLSWLGHVLAAFYLVWLLNLYNFMDGIDGIASVEAMCVALGGAAIWLLASGISGTTNGWLVPLLLAAAVAGFLMWNFPPARIFMGDAGSGFIGIVLGVLSIQAAIGQSELLWAWLILLGVFVVDATLTLLRRLVRGEKVYEAHRSHAYQFAARLHGRHLPVTLAVLVINVLWLSPLAVAVAMGWLDGLLALLVAYAPLVFLGLRYRAGQAE